MTDYAELMKRLQAASRIWRQYAEGPNTPTFSRGDGREFQEQFQAAADAVALLIAERDEVRTWRDAWERQCIKEATLYAGVAKERDALATEVRKLQAEHRLATDDAITEGARVDALTKEVARLREALTALLDSNGDAETWEPAIAAACAALEQKETL